MIKWFVMTFPLNAFIQPNHDRNKKSYNYVIIIIALLTIGSNKRILGLSLNAC